MLDILQRHRGPFRLMVTRPFATKPGFFHSEFLAGYADDVPAEVEALLTDPRDTITAVYVWSESEENFVTWRAKP